MDFRAGICQEQVLGRVVPHYRWDFTAYGPLRQDLSGSRGCKSHSTCGVWRGDTHKLVPAKPLSGCWRHTLPAVYGAVLQEPPFPPPFFLKSRHDKHKHWCGQQSPSRHSQHCPAQTPRAISTVLGHSPTPASGYNGTRTLRLVLLGLQLGLGLPPSPRTSPVLGLLSHLLLSAAQAAKFPHPLV